MKAPNPPPSLAFPVEEEEGQASSASRMERLTDDDHHHQEEEEDRPPHLPQPQPPPAPGGGGEQWQRTNDHHPLLRRGEQAEKVSHEKVMMDDDDHDDDDDHYSYTSSSSVVAWGATREALLSCSTAETRPVHLPAHGEGFETRYDDDDEVPRRSQLPFPTLRSLQISVPPAYPEEQDRKKFVGCLAAVLAAAYDYDTTDHPAMADPGSELDPILTSSFMTTTTGFCSQQEQQQISGNRPVPPVSSSVEFWGKDEDDDDDEDADHDQGQPRDEHGQNGDDRGASSHRHHLPPRSQSTSLPLLAGDAASRDHRERLARHRHTQRRYQVLSKLLLSSTDWLQLEKSQAKAFLPILSTLLHPTSKTFTSHSVRTQESTHRTEDMRIPPIWRSASGPLPSWSSRPTPRSNYRDLIRQQIDRVEHLRPFLESMTPGAGFRCLTLLLMQQLLHGQDGYDARIRHAVKTVGVLVLIHDMESDPVDVLWSSTLEEESIKKKGDHHNSASLSAVDLIALATRKFESLEHHIAQRLLGLWRQQRRGAPAASLSNSSRVASEGADRQQPFHYSQGLSREQIMRGLKIGGTAVVAGTLFAVTGGLAAPGIATAVAALAGSTAATAAAAAVLTSTAAVTTIFGVGGGSLAAYKMQRRTQGLTEFEFQKETGKGVDSDDGLEAELYSTVCISGWLRDKCDFQRPWGVSPSNPRLDDRQELLERFYSVYRPDHVPKCRKILESWRGEEKQLWALLRQKYGRDPDHLFPLADGPRFRASLTLEQREVVDQLFKELGFATPTEEEARRKHGFHELVLPWRKTTKQPNISNLANVASDSLHCPVAVSGLHVGSIADGSSVTSSGFDSVSTAVSTPIEFRLELDESKLPKHLATVWDYQVNYGGELYTVKWESDLLEELCDSVADLAFDVVSGGTAQILKHTAFTTLSSLFTAIAWPYALVNAANLIDGTWTLAVERSDEAGKELARSLLFSRAGHRPVTLVGFSFGARTIYSCLKELARYQEEWEDYRERRGAEQKANKAASNGIRTDGPFQHMREPASIIEDAILMGLPNHLSVTSWGACRQIVAGRLVNCYSQRDLILSLMFQFKRLGLKPVCGTCPVEVKGVENYDVTDLISGHEDYCYNIGEILKRVRHGQPFRSLHVVNSVAITDDCGSIQIEKHDI